MAEWSIYKNHGSDGKGDLVDPAQLPAAQEHKITIDIVSMANSKKIIAGQITGFMKDQFNYSVGAQYNKIIDIPSGGNGNLFRYVKDVANADAIWHSGFFSKKVFEPGNAYSKLDLKFRVYDNPYVVRDCDLLVACCLPMVAGKVGDSRNTFLNTSMEGALVGLVKESVTSVKESVNALIDDGPTAAAGTAMKNILGASSTRKPPHLNVSIGSYFKKNEMVLTNVDFTYSKEFAYSEYYKRSYPVYVDFNITVESLYSMLAIDNVDSIETNRIFGTGFGEEQHGTRVRMVHSGVVENPVEAAVKKAIEGTTDIKPASPPK